MADNNANPQVEPAELSQAEINEQRQVKRDKLKAMREMGRDPFVNETWDITAHSMDIKNNFEAMEGEEVSVAGRIMAFRRMGKVAFVDLLDKQGRIQVFVARDNISADEYNVFKTYDVGDIIGLKGEVFMTKTGEISIRAEEVVLLCKSIQVLPNKWHGLKDVDMRYRQRYVDLIMNENVRDTFIKRATIIKTMRDVLENDYDFLEVETPVLGNIAGGANARPFSTHHNTLDIDLNLRISLELHLKRLIVGGLDRVFEIGKVFRNEGMDKNHSPEFTSMEAYMAYGNLENMMDLMEQIVYKCAMEVNGTPIITYGDKTFDVTPPWNKIDMTESVIKVTGIPFDKIDSDEEALDAAKKYGMTFEDLKESELTRGKIIAEMFENYCEDLPGFLDGPCFVCGHPVEVSPLAKKDPKDPRITRRFESYINGWEISNAFSELNDPIDQFERFSAQQRELDLGLDDEAHPMDMDFVNALEVGLPPTGGIGIGVDRMVMLLTNEQTIRDVQLFPTMKPEGKGGAGSSEKKIEKIDLSKIEIEPLYPELVDFDTFSKSDFRVVKVKSCEAVPKSKKLLQFTLNDGTDAERVILSGIHDTYEPEELVGKTCVAIVNLPPRKMMGVESNGMLLSAVNNYDGEEMLNLLMLDDHIPAGAKLY
ncbi:MAG: lysine--tRNA ligase [Clostridiales bacterium]|jgi:lysyl-tRNA synthetase class 2|nr:lysine--tRNA ligase [Clostridiales bacterium]